MQVFNPFIQSGSVALHRYFDALVSSVPHDAPLELGPEPHTGLDLLPHLDAVAEWVYDNMALFTTPALQDSNGYQMIEIRTLLARIDLELQPAFELRQRFPASAHQDSHQRRFLLRRSFIN